MASSQGIVPAPAVASNLGKSTSPVAPCRAEITIPASSKVTAEIEAAAAALSAAANTGASLSVCKIAISADELPTITLAIRFHHNREFHRVCDSPRLAMPRDRHHLFEPCRLVRRYQDRRGNACLARFGCDGIGHNRFGGGTGTGREQAGEAFCFRRKSQHGSDLRREVRPVSCGARAFIDLTRPHRAGIATPPIKH
jgi:hypothetical protein